MFSRPLTVTLTMDMTQKRRAHQCGKKYPAQRPNPSMLRMMVIVAVNIVAVSRTGAMIKI